MYQASYVYGSILYIAPPILHNMLPIYKEYKTLKMYKEVGMACQKVCKQGRNDIKRKVVYKALSIPTSFSRAGGAGTAGTAGAVTLFMLYANVN